jgi:hypothetical protein
MTQKRRVSTGGSSWWAGVDGAHPIPADAAAKTAEGGNTISAVSVFVRPFTIRTFHNTSYVTSSSYDKCTGAGGGDVRHVPDEAPNPETDTRQAVGGNLKVDKYIKFPHNSDL